MTGPAGTPRWVWAPALVVVFALAAALAWFPLVRVFADIQINHNEGWNATRQVLAQQGTALFAAPPADDITNYPTLSFHVIGALGRVVGDVNMAGRLVALGALAGIVILAVPICRQFGAGSLAGVYAGAAFLVWLAFFQDNRIGMNDPQMLALFLQMAGLLAFLRSGAGRGALVASAALFALAAFTKHSLVAIPVAVCIGLLAGRRWRDLAVWLATGIAVALVLLAAMLAVDGPHLLEHLLAPRSFSAQRAFWKITGYVVPCQLFLGIAAAWSACSLGHPRRRVLAVGWIVATVVAFAGVGVAGVDQNVFHDAMVLTTVITALALSELAASATHMRLAAAVLALAPFTTIIVEAPGRVKAELADWRQLPGDEGDFRRGVAVLHRQSGRVLCEDPLLCHAAGTPTAMNPSFLGDQVRLGRRPLCDMLEPVEHGRYAAIMLTRTHGDDQDDPGGRFPPAVSAAIRSRYRVAVQARGFTVLLPDAGAMTGPGLCR